ncbi:MAG: ribosome biogenesis GTPase Der [Spirochaetia bacterium]|jgi:GTP-binding protein|nr:ribosome biogenesis GTPase Der [Spirochaetia bacterium]
MSDLITSQSENGMPVIAVIGRPNVGKSTLFNRMLGKRKAITDPTPGVTRDPIEGIYNFDNRSVKLIDTGGYKVEQEGLDSQVSNRSLKVMEDADLVLFIMDVVEITPEDEALKKILRRYSKKVIVVVNKVDNHGREADVWNFFSLGFEHVIGMSAEHGLGLTELDEKLEELIDFDIKRETEDNTNPLISLAIMGKPNTGKSTLTNRLLGRKASIVSDIPGTTRDIVEGSFDHDGKVYKVLDTAGIRRKKKVGENVEYYSVNRAFKSIDEADVVLLMIDAIEGLADQDKKIAAQIVNKGRGVILVLNKWDKLKEIPNQMEAVKDRIKFLFPILSFAPVVPISALTGEGVDKILNQINNVWSQLNKRVDTARVNEALKRWTENQEPPRHSSGRFKVSYGTQVRTNPVHFVFFINRKNGFPDSYQQYIINNIRKDLGFSQIPLQVDIKEKQWKV